jgi:hypothetical protein
MVPKGDSLGPPFGSLDHALDFHGFSSVRQALRWFRLLVLGDKSREKLLGTLEFSYRIAVPRLGGIGSTKTLRGEGRNSGPLPALF